MQLKLKKEAFYWLKFNNILLVNAQLFVVKDAAKNTLAELSTFCSTHQFSGVMCHFLS